jgi:hypothetical protein
MKGYPRWTLPTLLWTTGAILATGLLLAPGTLVTRGDIDLAWMLPSNGRLVTAALHATAGFMIMLLVGALWSIHMRAGWRKGRHRVSGLTLALLMPALALSAVGVYYFGDETWAAISAFIHLGLGVALAAVFGWHWGVRRSR